MMGNTTRFKKMFKYQCANTFPTEMDPPSPDVLHDVYFSVDRVSGWNACRHHADRLFTGATKYQ